MRTFLSLKKGVAAFCITALMTSAAFGADYTLDDFEDGGSDVLNNNRGAWYVYDDASPSWDKSTYDPETDSYTDEEGMLKPGNSRFTGYGALEFDVDALPFDTIYNENGDILEIKRDYPTFVATPEAGQADSRGLKISFRLGDEFPEHAHGEEMDAGYLGIGTGLMPDGQFAILDSDMSIKFDIRADIPENPFAEHLNTDFQIQTNQWPILMHSNFYHQEIQITSEWQTMEFELKHASDSEAFEGEMADWTLKEEFADHFVQNNWWNQWGSDLADEVYWGWETETAEEFVEQIEADPLWAQSIALQWAIPNSKDGNNAFLRDTEEEITIYIDNVEITNYEPTFEDQLSEEDAWDETHGTEGDLIWDVGPTTEVGSENEYFGNAWYGYSIDDEAQLETIDEADESFSLDFVLGPPDSTVIGSGDTVEVAPFAGVAADMYTDADSTLYNATEAGFDGLRFTYSTEGVEWLQVRLYDSNEFSQDGTVFHVAVPGTNGESKTATISFDDLTLPWWNTDDQDKSFRPDEIENLAFVYQGEEAETGTISLSNVKFMSDTEKRTKDITDIIADDKITAARDNFSVDLNDMSLNIAIPEGVSEGRALLYSVKGELVKSQELNTAQNMSTLSTENIANGTYILRVVSTEGTRANFVRAISINR